MKIYKGFTPLYGMVAPDERRCSCKCDEVHIPTVSRYEGEHFQLRLEFRLRFEQT